jgi:hypothetical protein
MLEAPEEQSRQFSWLGSGTNIFYYFLKTEKILSEKRDKKTPAYAVLFTFFEPF